MSATSNWGWPPFPSIADARARAKENKLDGLIIMAFRNGKVKAASYGTTVERCRSLGAVVDSITEQAFKGAWDLSGFERNET